MIKEHTATVYIFEENRTLLILHRKMQKWVPPGGHVEENELPCACAKREALEETGLHVKLIQDEHVWIERWNAESFERPWICLLENIPEYKSEPAHQHIDFCYVGQPIGGAIGEQHRSQHAIRWFTLDEVKALIPDKEIFVETQQILETLFKKIQCFPSINFQLNN